jgi:palmitoyl transferase
MRLRLTHIIIGLCFIQHLAYADGSKPCEGWPSWLKPICMRPYQTWTQGDNELYLSGYAWHNRNYYDKDRLHRYNEKAFGGGLGKSFYDERGNWHGLFAIAFQDSHRYLEPAVGYAYLKVLHFTENFRAGLGYSLLVTQRPDICKGIPFPGALPWASISYRRVSISATYIPGSRNVGNVLYAVAKWVI